MKIQHNESQTIEFKKLWKDEYIRWISAFANSQGGVLYIGVDNNAQAIGLDNTAKLMDDIPNKVRDILGIMVEVNLKSAEELLYIEIITEPYPYPVSYKGAYYYRSGSSTLEFKGAALDRFLLSKQGKTWDSVPVPYLSNADLDPFAFKLFRQKAESKKRIDTNLLDESDLSLVDKLHLKDGGYFKRAATLLFISDPQKYVTGSVIKIGYFKSDSDLIYQDVVDGNLFAQVDKTMELIFSKYLKAIISYDGIQRMEVYPISQLAFREALINAVVHKDYSTQHTIQISVYDDKLLIWNPGALPPHWDIDTLLQKHSSEPFNPNLAYAFFLTGYIESWGRGIDKIMSESKRFNNITPVFRWQNGLWIEFYFNPVEDRVGDKVGDKVGDNITDNQIKILEFIEGNQQISAKQLSSIIGISIRKIEENIKKLKEKGMLERVGSAKGGYWKVLK